MCGQQWFDTKDFYHVQTRRMGKRPSDVSVARDQLIRKGLLYAPDRGTIAFTVPGMAEFVRRQAG